MNKGWKTYKIGEILTQTRRLEKVEPGKSYKLLGLRLEGRGLFIREQKLGLEISASILNKVCEGDFIYSRLFAWKGAFDYVRSNVNGCYASGEFPTFSINKDIVDIDYLYYYFNQKCVWHLVEQYCIGVTKASRNRFKEHFFLSMNICLPPLSEQQRIVSKIKLVEDKLKQIQSLNIQQEQDTKNSLFSLYIDLVKNAPSKPMKEVAPIKRNKVEICAEHEYKEIGVRSFGKGTFDKPSFKGADLTWQKPYWMKEGDLLFSNIKAWEGAVALIEKKDDGKVGSHRYITCRPDLDIVIPEYLLFHLLLPSGIGLLSQASPGTADRNRTLQTRKLEAIQVPVPKIEKQRQFVKILKQFQQLNSFRVEQQIELQQLIPSLLDKAFKGELLNNKENANTRLAAEPHSIYESIPKSQKKEDKHFLKRKVLASYIINQSLDDKQFGDVKFEKLLHLADYFAIQRNFGQKYYKKPAGPYDNSFTYPFFNQVLKAKWFKKEKYGKLHRIVAGEKHEKSLLTYDFFSEEELMRINELIAYFKSSNYERPEIISTLYAVWNNRIKKKLEITDELLKKDFLEWDKKKVKYKDRLDDALNWMRKEGIVPNGWGQIIEKVA